MKKQLLAIAVAAMACVAAQADTLAKVKSSGAITMGVRDSSGALSYTLGDGKYAGFHIEICQRIVALHGGQLKIVSQAAAQADDPLRGIESFHLSLPTGAPLLGRNLAACTNCLAPRQAEQYARDLAALTSVLKAD